MRLLPSESLVRTGPTDHPDRNYKLVLGPISRARWKLAGRLLPAEPVGRLLEVGYGSGVFLPELATRCRELFALDPHNCGEAVAEKLSACDVDAVLTAGSAEAMRYPDGHFDRVVAVSCLEFIQDIEAAVGELCRVLAPGGSLVCVTPGCSKVGDFGLKVLTGEIAKTNYADRREHLVAVLSGRFEVRRELRWPAVVCRAVPLYRAMELVPR